MIGKYERLLPSMVAAITRVQYWSMSPEVSSSLLSHLQTIKAQVSHDIVTGRDLASHLALRYSTLVAAFMPIVTSLAMQRLGESPDSDVELSRHRDLMKSVAADLVEAQKSAKASIAKIRSYEEQGGALLHIVAAGTIASEYRSAEKSEFDSYTNWQRCVIGALVAILVVSAWALYVATFDKPQADGMFFAVRGAFAVALAGVAGYAGSQATNHRDEYRRLRLVSLGVAAISPYVAEFPEADKIATKKFLAERLFVQSGGRVDGPSAADLAVKMVDATKTLAEAAKNVTGAVGTISGPGPK